MTKPTFRLRRFMWFYGLLWTLMLPVVMGYLWWRGRKDPRYVQKLAERFGVYEKSLEDSVWIHAVSLGELRSAAPLINTLLERGERVVTTHLTPAGRAEAERLFADPVAEGRFVAAWIPMEFRFGFKRFFRAFNPKFCLVMEIEIWPRMIMSAERAGIPLFLCNAQYPKKSFDRDAISTRWRADLHRHIAGAFVKSEIQKSRFDTVGTPNVEVTGELRFDQPIPAALLATGQQLKTTLLKRRVIALPSVVEGEDETYMSVIQALAGPDCPLFVYVPRAPERFEETAELLSKSNISFARRSEAFGPDLSGNLPTDIDVLLGDSMGEMYFYLAMADLAIIGGSFVPKGAHNVSEPLALGKPCIVGPHIWTIEFPIVEAMAAGVAHQVANVEALLAYLKAGEFPTEADALAFAESQMGSTDRTINALKAKGLI